MVSCSFLPSCCARCNELFRDEFPVNNEDRTLNCNFYQGSFPIGIDSIIDELARFVYDKVAATEFAVILNQYVHRIMHIAVGMSCCKNYFKKFEFRILVRINSAIFQRFYTGTSDVHDKYRVFYSSGHRKYFCVSCSHEQLARYLTLDCSQKEVERNYNSSRLADIHFLQQELNKDIE